MVILYRFLGWFLGLYLACSTIAEAQFVQSPFRFENEIVDIVDNNNQRFAATATKGLFVSDDSGKSWERRWLPRQLNSLYSGGFKQLTINKIAFIQSRLWAMTDGGMYVSDDSGFNWRRIQIPNEYISVDGAYTSTYFKLISQGEDLFVSERIFIPQQAQYGFRLLRSSDKGEHWSVVSTPASPSNKLSATDELLLLSTSTDTRSIVYSSSNRGQSWDPISERIPFETITSVTANGASILLTGYRTIKDSRDNSVVITMLASSLDNGKNWHVKELTAVNYVPYSSVAGVINKKKFVVAMTNQLAYSEGDGNWYLDSLGLKSPYATPEGAFAVISDTLWAGYMDKRMQSDQHALKGYLLYRPLSDLSPNYIASPSLLQADNNYQGLILLNWKKANPLSEAYYYSIERADESPVNFRPIAQVPVISDSYIDDKIKPGKLYYYRLRTEHRTSVLRSRYSPTVAIANADINVRAAYLSHFEDLQMPSGDTLFARSGSELVRSIDGGKAWSMLNPCFFNSYRLNPYFGKYNSLSFPTSRVGYVLVGTGSGTSMTNILLKTVDGGETWNTQNFRPSLDVVKIIFVNESTGYALIATSFSGYLLYKTNNGGRDFQLVSNAPRFTKLQYKNGLLMGQAANGQQQFFFTADGGQTWNNTNRYTTAAHIFDTKRFVVGITGGDSTYVRLTNDGGNTWQSTSGYFRRYDQINDIQFIDDQRGFLIGGYTTGNNGTLNELTNFVYQTIDGGRTWTPIKQPETVNGEAIEMALKKDKVYILYRASRSPESSMLGAILTSDDAGRNWQLINNLHSKSDYNFESLTYRNEKEGLAITSSGSNYGVPRRYTHYTTKDGGLTWLRKDYNEPDDTWLVRFIAPSVGFRVGNNVVYYTLDGGKGWQKVSISQFAFTKPSDRSIPDAPNNNGLTHGCNIQFLTSDTWIALSDDYKLYETTNRGQSWQVMNTPTLMYPMFYFINQRVGYVSVENKLLGNQLWKTKDGGLSWVKVGSFDENTLFFLNEDIGFAGIKRTTDGGKHWYTQDDLIRPAGSATLAPNYRFINDQIGNVGTNNYTTDAGAHWSSLPFLSENVNDENLSLGGSSFYDSYATLLGIDRYYGTSIHIVPTNVPCSPLMILGDTIVFVDKTASSTYTAVMLGWGPNITTSWAIDGGGTLRSELTSAKVDWTEKGSDTYTISVRSINNKGESKPTTLRVQTKVVITALELSPLSVVTLYPNPAQTSVKLKIPISESTPSVVWYDASGKQLAVTGNPVTGYSVENMPAGVYFVSVQTEHYKEIKRILIMH